MRPSARENESKNVCLLLCYALKETGVSVPKDIETGANDCYGDTKSIDANTESLCTLIRGLSTNEKERIVYDGKSADSRKLADWWEKHQEVDRLREVKESEEKENKKLKASAAAKLTQEELKALGL